MKTLEDLAEPSDREYAVPTGITQQNAKQVKKDVNQKDKGFWTRNYRVETLAHRTYDKSRKTTALWARFSKNEKRYLLSDIEWVFF